MKHHFTLAINPNGCEALYYNGHIVADAHKITAKTVLEIVSIHVDKFTANVSHEIVYSKDCHPFPRELSMLATVMSPNAARAFSERLEAITRSIKGVVINPNILDGRPCVAKTLEAQSESGSRFYCPLTEIFRLLSGGLSFAQVAFATKVDENIIAEILTTLSIGLNQKLDIKG